MIFSEARLISDRMGLTIIASTVDLLAFFLKIVISLVKSPEADVPLRNLPPKRNP